MNIINITKRIGERRRIATQGKSRRMVAAAILSLLAFAWTAQSAPLTTPGNLLEGEASWARNIYGYYPPDPNIEGSGALAVDGTTDPLLLDWRASRLVVHGFESDVERVRLWSLNDGSYWVPDAVTIKSSLSNISSLEAGDYETLLLPVTEILAEDWTFDPNVGPNYAYVDFLVSAPAGTQSLFFDFGVGSGLNVETRIVEVQAFAVVPEPQTWVMMALGLALSLGHARLMRSRIG